MKDGSKNRTHMGLWYKINGKSATKAEYMAYENKPGDPYMTSGYIPYQICTQSQGIRP